MLQLVVSDAFLPVLMGHLSGLREVENVLDSHVVFHLPQLPHDIHGVLFACRLLHCGILLLSSARMPFPCQGSVANVGHHEHVILLITDVSHRSDASIQDTAPSRPQW